LIDIVKEKVGSLPTDRNLDVWYLKQLLQAHRAREVVLLTSFLSTAECVAIEAGQTLVSPVVQEHFRSLITSGQYLSLVANSPSMGAIAQDLRWKHSVVLGGPGVLHVASAMDAKCVEFLTTDDRLQKPKVANAAQALGALGLKMIRARDTKHLPDAYRQGDLENGRPEN